MNGINISQADRLTQQHGLNLAQNEDVLCPMCEGLHEGSWCQANLNDMYDAATEGYL